MCVLRAPRVSCGRCVLVVRYVLVVSCGHVVICVLLVIGVVGVIVVFGVVVVLIVCALVVVGVMVSWRHAVGVSLCRFPVRVMLAVWLTVFVVCPLCSVR